ncbi:MAG: hypothetical protein KDB27_11185 [Planctomycetales bacterium]|nr:hypothetical protein [Planctomycetales bacterium]
MSCVIENFCVVDAHLEPQIPVSDAGYDEFALANHEDLQQDDMTEFLPIEVGKTTRRDPMGWANQIIEFVFLAIGIGTEVGVVGFVVLGLVARFF